MLLEEADRLNKRNVELTERIRLLEEGLASIQAGISDEIHPLLARTSPDGADDLSESANVQREVDEVNDSLGTLTIGKDGRSLFLGNTAGIEVSCYFDAPLPICCKYLNRSLPCVLLLLDTLSRMLLYFYNV